MKDRSRRRILMASGIVVGLAAVAAAVFVIVSNRGGNGPQPPEDGLPRPDTEAYRETVAAFSSGVTALDADAPDRARAGLTRATQLVPGEPAAWANLGLLGIRLGDYDAATRDLEKARELAPEVGAIERLLGLLESRRGRSEEAIAHLRKAVERDPADLKSLFALAQELERLGGPESEAEALRLTAEILKQRPDNLSVLMERARLAAKVGDAEALRDAVAALGRLAGRWPARAQEQLRVLEQAAAGQNPRAAATRVIVLRNLLVTDPAFRASIDAVQTPIGMVGEPFERFLKLPQPPPTPSAPDEAIAFAVEPLTIPGDGRRAAVVILPIGQDGPLTVLAADGREVRRLDRPESTLPFPGGPSQAAPSPDGLLAADWNSDYLLDLVLAGEGGLRLFQQGADGAFADVTDAAGLEPDVAGAAAVGAWASDIESDGDLDLVIGARTGPPLVLQNHGDGRFGTLRPFEGAAELRGFAWADLDQDGIPDAGLLDQRGTLRIYANERSGRFRERPLPDGVGKVATFTIGDLDGDGVVDLLVLKSDGSVARISDRGQGASWEVAEVARWPDRPEGEARLFVADLDNNGALDLVASGPSGSRAWLGAGEGGPKALDLPAGFRIQAVADLTGDGRLDLAGLTGEGAVARGVGKGAKDYHWQVIRPRAARNAGDGRINSFGLGGEVEVRSGLLVQKQVIAGPTLHFGLGDHSGADVARIVWPNGTVLAEFDLKADQALLAEQRLKGSCPFVYADDGNGMRFVTDFLWRSPLGLRINAQDTAGVSQTEDWIKIRGDQLAPRDGYYDVRITAELWETHYFDQVSLLVVDHEADSEVFVDERFARTPPAPAVHATGPLRPVASARDDGGRDVTDLVRTRDGRYLDTFGRGPYQGVTRDHWVEVEVGEDVPRDVPLWLVAGGWIHPTDSSINVALAQGRHAPPQGLVLEVPTADGGWSVARPDLGFPAGKDKTILVDLDGVFRPGQPRRFRLRANLEIFWDSLALAAPKPDARLDVRRIVPADAELRFRGYTRMTRADDSSPELPHYDERIGTSQRWRDLIGFYTRFGDVRELLEKVDDRYAIVNAGDEVAFRFPAPPPPPEGWARDFVLVGDGWNKDGDYNTAFSETVLPLPSHDRPGYDSPPGELEDDPVYQRHPEDWEVYHTRYVTPRVFRGGLRPDAASRP